MMQDLLFPDCHVQLVKQLKDKVSEVSDEIAVLRECLDEAGILRSTTVLARLHRFQFDRARRLHPWSSSASVLQVLRTREMALGLAACTGPPVLHALAACSRSTDAAVTDISPAINRIFPRQIYVCGGIDVATKQRMRSAECFDLVTGAWVPLPPMTEARSGSASAVASGGLYVCGGKLDSTQCSGLVERFDPASHAWTVIPMLPHRCSHAAAAVVRGCLHVCGGFDGMQYLASASCFLAEQGRWEALPPMSERRSHAVAASMGGQLHICGGKGEGSQRLSSGERFNCRNHAWEPIPPMLERRSQAACAVVGGGLYVCGGFDGFQHLCSMEFLDRVTGTWRPLPSMQEARSSAVAASLAKRVYMCGGFDGSQHLRSVEVFSATTRFWSTLRPMQTARAHAAGGALWSMPRSGSLRRFSLHAPLLGSCIVEDV